MAARLKWSLLVEKLFLVETGSGRHARMSLPEVLAQLSAGQDLQVVNSRPHQRAAWHAFVVQLAYLALEPEEEATLPTDPEAWTALLRCLTEGWPGDEPWHLVVEDWQQPAFLQSPCSPAHVQDFKRETDAVQDLDVLVTSRHHDEKSGKLAMDPAALDSLVYALIALQGWSPFLGAGNYNTMRMNGGFSSRSMFRLAFSRGAGAEFTRDVQVLLEGREQLLSEIDASGTESIGSSSQGVQGLLWLEPWDGASLPLQEVHPYCLEVCRRVRLVDRGEGLRLLRASSAAMRVNAKAARGHVMDPWVPIVKDANGPKALTAQRHTLGYRSLRTLLFDPEACRLPLLARVSPRERIAMREHDATLLAQVLVSGDGGTDGLLSRAIRIPGGVVDAYATEGHRELGLRSLKFVELASLLAGSVYRPALLQFLDGSEEVDWKNRDFGRLAEPWMQRLDATVDEAFFEQLFDSFSASRDDAAAQRQWVRWLVTQARRELGRAVRSLPTRNDSRLFADVRARQLFGRAANKHLGAWLDDAPHVTVPIQEPANA